MWMHKHHDDEQTGRGQGGGPRGPFFGGHRGPWGGGGRGDGERGEGRWGGRMRRGGARYVLLDVLRDGPKHGYEIIKALEERSGGQYAPSPGMVYPTLQYLEEQGLVRAEPQAERRVYHLTESGRASLDTHADELKAFWARFTNDARSNASHIEIGFLREDMEDLMRTVRGGLQGPLQRDDPETVRTIRRALARCKEEVRTILAGSDTA